MPGVTSVMTSVLLAPLVVLMSSLSLVSLQRGVEWVQNISTTPQKGTLKTIKPYVKQLNVLLERILGNLKFEVTTTGILLMAIVVLLIASLIDANERAVEQDAVLKASVKAEVKKSVKKVE